MARNLKDIKVNYVKHRIYQMYRYYLSEPTQDNLDKMIGTISEFLGRCTKGKGEMYPKESAKYFEKIKETK